MVVVVVRWYAGKLGSTLILEFTGVATKIFKGCFFHLQYDILPAFITSIEMH